MSNIQDIAGMRWIAMCLLHGGRANFKQVRECFTRLHFLLSHDEREENESRGEAAYETGMRNFKRDVTAGKHPYFEDVPNGLRFTPEGMKLIGTITGSDNNG